MKITTAVFVLPSSSLLLAACAPYSSDISPAPISDARYDGWGCAKLQKERAFVDDSVTRVSAEQDHDASHDALMVFLIGVPTSGGGVKGEVAELKGQQIALHEAMLDQGCLNSTTDASTGTSASTKSQIGIGTRSGHQR
ncbi:MAG: hypothetical protein ACREN3_11275 [Gemmatimonadaceae bacterium]